MTRNPFNDGDTAWSIFLTVLLNAHNEESVATGCTPSKGAADWDTDVAAGTLTDGTSVGAQTVSHTEPANDADMDAGESRIDLVTVNTSGTAAITEGAAADEPLTPDVPSDEVVVAAWHIEESDATLASSDLFDVRVIRPQWATESGEVSLTTTSGLQTVSVSFTNTYIPRTFVPSVGEYDSTAAQDDWGNAAINTTLSTDGSGNIDGMTVQGQVQDQTVTASWFILGKVA